jgi:hypothetical protein
VKPDWALARPRLLMYIAMAGLAVAVLSVALLFTRGGPSQLAAGPLRGQTDVDSITITGIALQEGSKASIGVYVPIESATPQGLVMDDVDLVGADPGLRLDEALISTGRGDSFVCVGASRRFPPSACRIWGLRDWTLSREALDHGFFQVVLGLSVDDPGVYGFAGVAVRYHDDTSKYRAIYIQGGQLCAPRRAYGTGCPDTEEVRARQQELASDLGIDVSV